METTSLEQPAQVAQAFGARRYAYNWALGQVKANLDARTADPTVPPLAWNFYELPREHWSKLRSTNPLERVNREIGRRTDVVGIFPNDAALLRLAGALLIEQNDEWLIARRYLSQESLELVLVDPPDTKKATPPTPALTDQRRSSATPRHAT